MNQMVTRTQRNSVQHHLVHFKVTGQPTIPWCPYLRSWVEREEFQVEETANKTFKDHAWVYVHEFKSQPLDKTQMWRFICVIPVLERKRQEDAWGVLGSQCNWIWDFWVQWENLSEKWSAGDRVKQTWLFQRNWVWFLARSCQLITISDSSSRWSDPWLPRAPDIHVVHKQASHLLSLK